VLQMSRSLKWTTRTYKQHIKANESGDDSLREIIFMKTDGNTISWD